MKKYRLYYGNLVMEKKGKCYLELDKGKWQEIPKELFDYLVGSGATLIK